jgi:hypothetical protein
MSQTRAGFSPLPTQDEQSSIAVLQVGQSNLTPLVAAAIAIGRMPGEPATILRANPRPHLLAYLLGVKTHGPLADPRLEVIRAISASLSRGINTIRADLVTAAANVGWSRDDLSLLFPTASLRAAL